ncbi:Uncharacterised protein [Clostridioides difficile]|nr:Uncharacterised protein [Clostridioides difficile]
MTLPVRSVGSRISCIIWWNTTMTGKGLPSIRKKMISGKECLSRNWNGWRGYWNGKHYIFSIMRILKMRRTWKNFGKSNTVSWKMNPSISGKYRNVSGVSMGKENGNCLLRYRLSIFISRMTSWAMEQQRKNSEPM